MLTLLFALAAIWTLFWFVMLAMDWGDRTSFSHSQALCPACGTALRPGSTATKPEASDNKSQGVAGLYQAEMKIVSTGLPESKTGFADHAGREHIEWTKLKKAG